MSLHMPGAVRWWRIDLAGIGACVLVTFSAYFFLVRPSKLYQIEYQNQGVSRAQKSESVSRARASLALTRKGLDLAETELRELPLTLMPGAGVNQRLSHLADLASRSGLEVYQMQPDSTRSGSRYDMVPITLSGSGDYRRVTSFLGDLHESFADIGVVEFDLVADNAGGGDARFDLGLVWYTTPSLSLVEE